MESRTVASVHRTRSEKQDGLKGKVRVLLGAILLCLLIIVNCNMTVFGQQSKACLFMDPPVHIAGEFGELFDLAVNISNVENLCSFSLSIDYNMTLLSIEQVTQGSFFPQPPMSVFAVGINDSAGSVSVEGSLIDTKTPMSGNGTLAYVKFKVIHNFPLCSGSPIELAQTLLLDSSSNPIAHDSVGAIYFWECLYPDPPEAGRLLDLATQKSGEGPNLPDGQFAVGEMVKLVSNVTYNGEPVVGKLVSFVVEDPCGEIVTTVSAITDSNGIASTSFRISSIPCSIGTWSVISVVDIANQAVWDTLSFNVLGPTIPVGGYSFSIEKSMPEKGLEPYLTLTVALMASFLAIRRKTIKAKR